MVPDIGILIAAYVFTRMVALLGTPITSKSGFNGVAQVAAQIFAGLTLIVALVVGIDLLLRGTTGLSLPELTR